MTKELSKKQKARFNPVAKHAHKYNKALVERVKTKYHRPKHKKIKVEDYE